MMLAYANFYKPDVWLIVLDGRRHHQTSQLESFSQIFQGNGSKRQTEGTQEGGDLRTQVSERDYQRFEAPASRTLILWGGASSSKASSTSSTQLLFSSIRRSLCKTMQVYRSALNIFEVVLLSKRFDIVRTGWREWTHCILEENQTNEAQILFLLFIYGSMRG